MVNIRLHLRQGVGVKKTRLPEEEEADGDKKKRGRDGEDVAIPFHSKPSFCDKNGGRGVRHWSRSFPTSRLSHYNDGYYI